jgi:squalene-hopene/tetraprenyl-beta-curcumene cyclase
MTEKRTIERQIDEMTEVLRTRLLEKRFPGKMWDGKLSSSAISTAVSVFALYSVDRERSVALIRKGVAWLKATMKPDGSWGDSIESPSNMTATLLAYVTLYAADTAPPQTKEYLTRKFGGSTDQHIIKGVLAYYGKDLTFSAPILVMSALAGVISDWSQIPPLPFEVSVLPQKMFRFFRLPVVSYAIPALIAVGILRYKRSRKNLFSPIRESFIPRSLKTLEKLQPSNGGFLEAAPLTGFVTMCLCAAGYREHITTRKGADFLTDTVREDGSWPIDTNLASWVTALSVRALSGDLGEKDKAELAALLKKNAYTHKHPFTGAKEGGWGWNNLPGAAPDADDTAGALVALQILSDGTFCREAGKGIEWLLDLQNGDGGMPTFCKGWGKLPFDRSSPDISAHAILAFRLWMDALPAHLQRKCKASMRRMLKWMQKNQAPDGSLIPLWFGDQEARNERSPVYATALTVEYLSGSKDPTAQSIAQKGLAYILNTQNKDGGWGGAKDVPSKVTLTARALSAIASFICQKEDTAPDKTETEALNQAFHFLYDKYKDGKLFQPEPIGLYFSRLWYSEELYNITFVLNALRSMRSALGKHKTISDPNK